MKRPQFTYYHSKLAKRVLAITLFFSIFIFSGYAGNSQARQAPSTQHELAIYRNQPNGKRTISCKKAFDLLNSGRSLNSADKYWINALFAYNTLTKERLDNISRQFHFHRVASRFLQVKTIPQNSNEDIL